VGLSDRDIKECQGVFDSKTPDLKQADIQAKVRGSLVAVVWKDK
jgi:hypothetical protein